MCLTHHKIRKQDILKLKKEHPKSEILVHPECKPEVIDIANYTFSTNGMVNHVKESDTSRQRGNYELPFVFPIANTSRGGLGRDWDLDYSTDEPLLKEVEVKKEICQKFQL